jgi:hypothetical protein
MYGDEVSDITASAFNVIICISKIRIYPNFLEVL